MVSQRDDTEQGSPAGDLFQGMDEKLNTLTMLAVMDLTWPDHRLGFSSKEYFPEMFHWNSKTDFLQVDADQVWKPDIQLVNAAAPVGLGRRHPWLLW